MFNHRIHNFSAGPSALPLSVLEKAQSELLNFSGAGMSVMEMSHRSKEFTAVIEGAQQRLRSLLGIPDSYEVLFLQGGASLQFSMIPMNLMRSGQSADVVLTGSWTKKAVKEIKRVGDVALVGSSEGKGFSYIPAFDGLNFNSDAAFAYITSNNTIAGTQYHSFPDTGEVPLVADMSSDILSKPFDVSQFGVIMAGAQKNMGPSGVTIVIIRKDLVERCPEDLPTMLQYRTHVGAGSLYNTPNTFGIYLLGLVLEWVESLGGLDAVNTLNESKSRLLYEAIDSSDFYYCPVDEGSRSHMNVVFRISGDREDLEAAFVKEATSKGLSGLKGHRSVGGLRASIYNAQPYEAVQALVDFMSEFEASYSSKMAHTQAS